MRRMLLAIATAAILMLSLGSECGSADDAAKAERQIALAVKLSEVIFAGVLVERHQSDCLPSGIATSRQGLTFRIEAVLRGEALVGSKRDIRVECPILGAGPLEVYKDHCYQLSPEIFRPGARFIIPCARRDVMPQGQGREWRVVGGPWFDTLEMRQKIKSLLEVASEP